MHSTNILKAFAKDTGRVILAEDFTTVNGVVEIVSYNEKKNTTYFSKAFDEETISPDERDMFERIALRFFVDNPDYVDTHIMFEHITTGDADDEDHDTFKSTPLVAQTDDDNAALYSNEELDVDPTTNPNYWAGIHATTNYFKQINMEIVAIDYNSPHGIVEIIALSPNDTLVFTFVRTDTEIDNGFPKVRIPKKERMELIVNDFIDDYPHFKDYIVRTDNVRLMVTTDQRAMLRHEQNIYGDVL